MTTACIQNYNGAPAIMINGQPFPPMTMTTECADKEYLKKLGEAGFRIFYVVANPNWNQPGDPSFEKFPREWAWFIRPDMSRPGDEVFLEDMATLFEAVPDAYVILRLNVGPSVAWINEHPNEQVQYSDGKKHPVLCTSASRYDEVDGMHSMCSEAWQQESDQAMHRFFDMLEKTAYFDRVIGVFLCAGGTSEWYYPNQLVLENGVYGDCSAPFKRNYERFLRNKYKTEEMLRKAWNDPRATFENPPIPTPAERFYTVRADQQIVDNLKNWLIKNPKRQKLAQSPQTNDGVFLNMNTCAHTADFYDALHEGTANAIIHFSQTIKTRYPNWMVGAFYGSYGCTSYYDGGTATGTLSIMNCGTVDFLAAPGVYNNREPGGIVAMREMQDSFRLRNQIFISEDDSRTHLCLPPAQRFGHELYTVKDSITTLKRDFARDICEDIQGWWFDMGGDWYNDPDILALFARQQEIAHFAYSLNREKKNEIALIYDVESVHQVAASVSQRVLDYYRTTDLGRIGAPVDYYFHNDMEREDMPDYKLYIMLNQYCLTAQEREAIFQKARKNHAVVLWLYAPGFVAPDGETKMDAANIAKTVGMKVQREEGVQLPHFFVDPAAHPAVASARASRRYGALGGNVHCNLSPDHTVLKPDFLCPAFSVNDPEAVVLGRSCATGQPFLALKEMEGYTSIYCSAQVISSDLLASLAAFAGCHLFLQGDDVLYANESFVAIHASSDGVKKIQFKKKCSPFEVYEKKYYGRGVDSIQVDMQRGETLMWHLGGEC